MNKRFDEGDPAFPVETPHGVNLGMSLRTYIAVEAMKGLMGLDNLRVDGEGIRFPDHAAALAEVAYFIADAMIAAQGDAT